jgi:hypothetical protein
MQIPDTTAAAAQATPAATPFALDTPVATVPFDTAQIGDATFVERMRTSFAEFAEVVPALIGALVILFAGYLLARLVERGVDRLLRRIHLNEALERGGVMQAVERSGSHFNPTRVIANLVIWLVMFVGLLLAANALGLQSLAIVFQDLLRYIPSVIAAVVIITVGIVLGGFVGGLIMASAGGIHGGPTLARVGKGGVIVLAIFMALQELGIATDIVTTAFAILFGAVALALALSFGLGNRDLAGHITREWYDRWKAERDAIARDAAAAEAAEQAEEAELDREVAEREAKRRAERLARKTPPMGNPPV